MRVRAPKPPRTFLEMDELVALIDAASGQDARAPVIGLAPDADPGTTRARVADALARGQRPSDIAAAPLVRGRPQASAHVRPQERP
jgi:hypothetical protein